MTVKNRKPVRIINKWSSEVMEYVQKNIAKHASYSSLRDALNKQFPNNYSRSSVRHKVLSMGLSINSGNHESIKQSIVKQSKNADGTYNSSITEQVRDKKDLTPQEMLKLHHFDPKCWQVLRIISNEWSVISGEEQRYNYQSKIQVAPKKIDMDALVDKVVSHVKPFTDVPSSTKVKADDIYAVYPLFDLHIDGKNPAYYREITHSLIQVVKDKPRKESLIIIGGDVFHVDSVASTTTKGTQLESVKVDDMLDSALELFEPFINAVVDNSENVTICSVAGNHDYLSGYFLARLLQAYFKNYNISWDIDLYTHYKAFLLGKNMICATHGDKGKGNYVSIFASRFPEYWAAADNRELFTGHLHSQVEKDLGGIIMRQEPTIKSDDNDQWTKDNGFISRKGILTYDYSEECVLSSHFIKSPKNM